MYFLEYVVFVWLKKVLSKIFFPRSARQRAEELVNPIKRTSSYENSQLELLGNNPPNVTNYATQNVSPPSTTSTFGFEDEVDSGSGGFSNHSVSNNSNTESRYFLKI